MKLTSFEADSRPLSTDRYIHAVSKAFNLANCPYPPMTICCRVWLRQGSLHYTLAKLFKQCDPSSECLGTRA